jgi:hypothetical protein
VPAGRDPVAKHYFKELDEVRHKQYDVVIVGGGAVGAAVLERLVGMTGGGMRVLVLEKGGFLLPEHVQNMDPRFQRLMQKAICSPWRLKNPKGYDLAPQIPYLGGRALFWSTWIPQPSREQMPDWPEAVTDELDRYWEPAKEFLGAVLPHEMGQEFRTFQPRLQERLRMGLDTELFPPRIQAPGFEVELASKATTSRLAYRKFSPVPVFVEAVETHPGCVDVVTGCEVLEVRHTGHRHTGCHCREGLRRATEVSTTQGRLPLGEETALVLANGIIESTGLLMDSFAGVLPEFTGTNLGGHVASWFSARVPRRAWPGLEGEGLQIGCLYLRGEVYPSDGHRRDFHIHLMGASNPHPKDSVPDLYRLIPDSFDQEFLQQLSDPDHIGFLVHCLGEWRSTPKDMGGSRVYVQHGETVLDIRPSATDMALRTAMDEAAQEVVRRVLARGVDPCAVEYWHQGSDGRPGAWSSRIPEGRMKEALVHESGTLWMGTDPAESVTDINCRLHHVDNIYVAGAATFPTSGSWNPTLAAVALGQRLADHLLARRGKGGFA